MRQIFYFFYKKFVSFFFLVGVTPVYSEPNKQFKKEKKGGSRKKYKSKNKKSKNKTKKLRNKKLKTRKYKNLRYR